MILSVWEQLFVQYVYWKDPFSGIFLFRGSHQNSPILIHDILLCNASKHTLLLVQIDNGSNKADNILLILTIFSKNTAIALDKMVSLW